MKILLAGAPGAIGTPSGMVITDRLRRQGTTNLLAAAEVLANRINATIRHSLEGEIS